MIRETNTHTPSHQMHVCLGVSKFRVHPCVTHVMSLRENSWLFFPLLIPIGGWSLTFTARDHFPTVSKTQQIPKRTGTHYLRLSLLTIEKSGSRGVSGPATNLQ